MYALAGLALLAALASDQVSQPQTDTYGGLSPQGAASWEFTKWALDTFGSGAVGGHTDGDASAVSISQAPTPDLMRQLDAKAAQVDAKTGSRHVIRPFYNNTAIVVFGPNPDAGYTRLTSHSPVTGFGAGEQRRWYYGADLIGQLKKIDGLLYKASKQILGLSGGAKLLARKKLLTQINAQRDALIASGADTVASEVLRLDRRFRDTIASILGLPITEKLERATRDLKAKRDALVRQIGTSGGISDWATYGGLYGVNLIEDQYGQLLRTDLFGQLHRTDMFEAFGFDRNDMLEDFGFNRTEMLEDYGLERLDLFGAEGDLWTDAWYGGLSDDRISELTRDATKVIKSILGWKTATKGPRLLSLNSKRDELILEGTPLAAPPVKAIEDEALNVLVDAGMAPGGPQHTRLQTIQTERDSLLIKKAAQA